MIVGTNNYVVAEIGQGGGWLNIRIPDADCSRGWMQQLEKDVDIIRLV